MFTSCLVDDESRTTSFDQGPNLASFTRSGQNLNAVTDGNEYDFDIVLELIGPTSTFSSEDVGVSVSIDAASTAIENVHYRFNSTSTTLAASNNHIGVLPITMITDGIMAPLAENPKLVLNIASASGTNVIANGNQLTLTFVYQCFADLSGTYAATNDFCNPSFMTEITANADGSWHIGSADGGFLHQCTSNTSLLNAGDITELCGDILPGGALDFGSDNFYGAIGDISAGTWDAVTGTLILEQSDDFFNGGPYMWVSTYVRQ
jgi:hypothetical protein